MHYITFIILFLLILIIILIIHQYIQDKKILETVTNKYRGTSTERLMVLKLLKSGISNKVIFHDLYLKKSGNQFCQIDIVVATKVGIVVFEIKKYNGWIFGFVKFRTMTPHLINTPSSVRTVQSRLSTDE